MYLTKYLKILLVIYELKIELITRIIRISIEVAECLKTSNFMFSFLLCCIIDLYNLMPLTAKATTHGITIRLLKNIVKKKNKHPLPTPKVQIMEDRLYPKQNPLKQTIK